MFDNGVFDNAKIILKNIDGENMPYACECEVTKYEQNQETGGYSGETQTEQSE